MFIKRRPHLFSNVIPSLIQGTLKLTSLRRKVLLSFAFTSHAGLAQRVSIAGFITESLKKKILTRLMKIILEMSLVELDMQLIRKTIQVLALSTRSAGHF